MMVRRIALNGWRNYEWETVEFSPQINVIRGRNAQGKTNLLEAVYMLAMGRSFRSRFDRELVGFGFSAAEILADVEAHGREQTIKITLSPGRRKQITVNAVKKTASELAGTITAVLFCPEDLAIVREGASMRRKLMDNAICQLRPGYAAALTEYNRLYEQKSAILRDYREKPSLLYTLDDFSERMCRLSARLIRYRAAFASRLDSAARPIHREFSGGEDQLVLSYKTVSTVENPFASEREIHLQETGEYPILLLDDVLSELDAKRQEFVLNRIGGGQTLITCCEDDGITARTGGRVITIDGGKAAQ